MSAAAYVLAGVVVGAFLMAGWFAVLAWRDERWYRRTIAELEARFPELHDETRRQRGKSE